MRKVISILYFLCAGFCCTEIADAQNTANPFQCTKEARSGSEAGLVLLAISQGNKSCVVEILSDGLNPNFRVDGTVVTSPIMVAMVKPDTDIIRELIRYGVKVNGEASKNALIIASSHGHLEIVRIFLNAGADINGKVKNKVNSLMAASYHGRDTVLDLLLKSGADVNAASDEGLTSLMLAANSARIVDLLVQAGAKLDAIDNNGWTAMFHAVDKKKTDSLRELLKKGSAMNIKDKAGRTALQLAERLPNDEGKIEVLATLREFGTK